MVRQTSYQLKVLPVAFQDLVETKEWYNLQKENLGEEFKAEIHEVFDYITLNPKHYQVRYKSIRQALLFRFPFSVFYFIDDKHKQVVVFGVLHFKRNPKIAHQRRKEIK